MEKKKGGEGGVLLCVLVLVCACVCVCGACAVAAEFAFSSLVYVKLRVFLARAYASRSVPTGRSNAYC